MKREEIEQLLLDYASGGISPENKQLLEALFKSDTQLKEEADEMLTLSQSLNQIEAHTQTSAVMDKQFYAMLQTAKNQQQPKNKVIQLKVSWIKTAAAIAACIIAFVAGRVTVSPVAVVKYKTVLVKQPVPYQPTTKQSGPAIMPATAPIVKSLKPKAIDEANPVLAQQLRSVYVSDRIDAVMKLTGKSNLNAADLKMLQLALSEDPNPNVRLTILNTLRPLAKQTDVQQVLISALNKQDDMLVQSSIVDMLVDAKSKQAIPQLIVLLDNEHTDAMIQNKIKGGIESFLN